MARSVRDIGGIDALRVIHEVARAITSSLELQPILRTIMDQMASYFQPEGWSLLLADDGKKDLHYAIAEGAFADELRDARLAIGEGVAGWAALHGETLMVENVADDPRFRNAPPIPFLVSKGRRQSVLAIPVQSRNRTVAVIQLVNSKLEALNDFTMYFLHVLTDYAAIAIDNNAALEKIRELTITDDCTGLFNARHLYKQLESEVDRSVRTHIPFSVIFIDLDRFKQVNDTHGHLIGSQLLSEVGAVLRNGLRNVDSAYRYGGDEFVAMLPHTSKLAALEVARRLYRTLRSHVFLRTNNLEMHVRASFGLATFPEDGKSVQELIHSADEMMYLVKHASRDNVAVAGMGLVGPGMLEEAAAEK